MLLQDMRYAITIEQEKSFSKAAEIHFISQSALSHCIKRLEASLGVQLFVREPYNVYPTAEGVIFLDQAKKIIEMTDTLEENMKRLGNSRTLRVGISTFYSKYYMPNIIPAFKTLDSTTKLSITEDVSKNMEILTNESRLDLCMVPFPRTFPDLQCHIVKEEQILLALPKNHPYNDRASGDGGETPIDLLDFANDKWIFLNKTQRFTDMAMNICANAGFRPNIVFETLNWDTVVSMIRTGEGIGFVPDVVVSDASQDIVFYNLSHYNAHRSYAIVYRADSPKIKEINTYIKACDIAFSQH